ncbi:hypothetical protein Ari01nite_51220 [Paractinoplanes rishiriensis]|uniref:Uncharacterized protein n=1 Tax=Paractinoplanes rishiriensis TaxID=1050105 RepID=A0A919N1S1_9ACTN|nr:hypothetical protein Ari01nite_51220 [Actinoplanes rishiriensis]
MPIPTSRPAQGPGAKRAAGTGARSASAALLLLCAALAGCAAEPPVAPLPTEAPSSVAAPAPSAPTSAPVSSAPTTSTTVTRRPVESSRPTHTRTTPPPPTTEPTSACQGAVVHVIDVANDELALVPALCVATGAVLRIEHIGPGEVTNDSPDLVEQRYEAGIVQIRMIRPGTVVVTIVQNGTPHDITVVVR